MAQRFLYRRRKLARFRLHSCLSRADCDTLVTSRCNALTPLLRVLRARTTYLARIAFVPTPQDGVTFVVAVLYLTTHTPRRWTSFFARAGSVATYAATIRHHGSLNACVACLNGVLVAWLTRCAGRADGGHRRVPPATASCCPFPPYLQQPGRSRTGFVYNYVNEMTSRRHAVYYLVAA